MRHLRGFLILLALQVLVTGLTLDRAFAAAGATPAVRASEILPPGSEAAGEARETSQARSAGTTAGSEQTILRARDSVVDIHIVSREEVKAGTASDRPHATAKPSTGSGVIIASDGLILTNEHVVRDAAEVFVVLADGSRCPASRVLLHRQMDLALLRINRQGLPALPACRAALERGMRVMAISGGAFGNAEAIRQGVITNVRVSLQNELDPRRRRLYDKLIESTARIEPGFSGGPLVDDRGNWVGLNVAVLGDPESPDCRGYSIPFDRRTHAALAELRTRMRQPQARRGR
jgi:S1-C subfamily serine protease